MKRILAMCCLMLMINGCGITGPPTQKGVKEDPETRAIYTVEEKTEYGLLNAGITIVVLMTFAAMMMNHSQSCPVTPGAITGC